ncbi:MAG: hypothetical protein KDN20_26220 [Verrucomicrobiae bacterium]|nr:hypothetical protein [Verrucomicrobiae bacterium]
MTHRLIPFHLSLFLGLAVVAMGFPIPATGADEAFVIDPWKPAFQGIEITRGKRDTTAGPEVMVAVRIDLKADGLRFFGTPDNGETALDTDGETGAQFLKRNDLQLAVNTAFFTPCCRYFGSEPLDVTGFAVSQGRKISEWNATRPMVMLISEDNEVSFVRSEPKSIDGI